MTKISRKRLESQVEKRIYEIFSETIVSLDNPQKVEEFFNELISPTEKLMLAKRLAIAILLEKGYTYEDIISVLKVSRTTIQSVSLWYKFRGIGYKKAVDKYINRIKKQDFIDNIEELLLKFSMPAAYGSLRYFKKQQEGKELYKKRLNRSVI